MATVRYDRLGRRIPEFDRSAANKKGFQTKEKKYGKNYRTEFAAAGGRASTRGYFGKLKDEGKEDELKELAKIGANNSAAKRKKE